MKKAKVVKMNFRTRCEVYEVAEKMLGELQPYVSKNLLAEIKERLMGFSPEMQVELADRVTVMILISQRNISRHGLKESIGINRCRSYEKPIRNRNLQVLRIM